MKLACLKVIALYGESSTWHHLLGNFVAGRRVLAGNAEHQIR